MMLGRELRLPVDLLCGHPEGEQTGLLTIYLYTETLQDSLRQVHEFARAHLKLTSDRMKKYYDVLSSHDLLNRGDAAWLYSPQRSKGLSLMNTWSL